MSLGPVVLTTTGDTFTDPARIASILWEGATSSGDTVEVRERASNALLWRCRTDSTQTYLGKTFSEKGLHAPSGFKLSQISAGQVLVYLREQ